MPTNTEDRIKISTTPDWYEPYAISQAIRVDHWVFASGQAGIDENGVTVSTDFEEQARQALRNLQRVLNAADADLSTIVKVTILVTDITMIDKVIELRREYFDLPYPADTIAQVAALAAPDWQIEIEAIALSEPN